MSNPKTSKMRCMSKKAFWSYAAAKRAAKRRGEVYGDRPRSYKCDNCELWHHTTTSVNLTQKKGK